MSGELLLALDAGTGSCRAVLFAVDGTQLGMAQREWSHAEVPGVPGSQVFDTETNWGLIAECVRQVLTESRVNASAIRALSTTSMREGMVLYDKSGRELWACPNVDSRAGVEATDLVQRGLAETIYRRGGDWVAITAPARLLWIQRHQPDVFEKAEHLTMLADWITHRLTGEFVTDPSIGSSSGMFDLARRSWSADIIDICGMRAEIFPPVLEPGSRAGELSAAAASATGLRAGTPVIVGGADTQLGLVGIGVVDPGQFTVIGGTFWQHTIGLSEAMIDPKARLRTLCHALPDQWMMEGIGFYCGLSMRWFRDAFCDPEKLEAQRTGVDATSGMRAVTFCVRMRVIAICMPAVTGVDAGGTTLSPCSSGASAAASSRPTLSAARCRSMATPPSLMCTFFALTTGSAMPASGNRLARDPAAGAASLIDSCLRASSTVKAVVHIRLLCWPSIDTCSGRLRRSTIVPVSSTVWSPSGYRSSRSPMVKPFS